MASIQDFPVELIALVFFHLRPRFASRALHDNLHNEGRFPNNVALVCRLWCNIMLRFPEYWGRFAIDLSSKKPLLLEAFACRKDLPFRVLIYYSLDITSPPALNRVESLENEQDKVKAVTEALFPHLHRCKSLEYEVAYSSSLPDLPYILQHASDLECLKLTYFLDNPITLYRDWSSYEDKYPPKWPILKNLSLNATIFMHLALDLSDWFHDLFNDEKNYGMHLTISRYEFFGKEYHGDSPRYTVFQLFEEIASLDQTLMRLSLHELTVVPRPIENSTSSSDSDRSELQLECLTCENVSREFLFALFSHFIINIEQQAVFTASSFPMNIRLQDSHELILEALPRNARAQHIFQSWMGNSLVVRGCDGFNDTFLECLFELGVNTEDCAAPRMQYIAIEDCTNFTFAALKLLIEERQASAREFGYHGYFNKIESLAVTGKAPHLTNEERRWFEENIDEVIFDSEEAPI